MSGRHQPLNGADSAEALADDWRGGWTDPGISTPNSDGTVMWRPTPPQCAACSLPAVPDDLYCAGHARLMEYRVTNETTWAANE